MYTPELSGKSMRHVNPPPSREIVQFQKMNVTKLPDSKRTLVPDLAVRIILLLYHSLNQEKYE